jgi:hypothetical protein
MISQFLKSAVSAGALFGVALSCASPAFAAKAKPLNTGEILSGELTAMRSKKTKGITFQLTSEPRRLPAPAGLCNLETGPETFQIVTNSASEAAELKPFIGKTVSLKANEMSCPQDAQQFSDAIVTKWSLVGGQ